MPNLVLPMGDSLSAASPCSRSTSFRMRATDSFKFPSLLSDPGLLVRSMCLVSLTSPTPSVNLTDVTLADKETNLILTDKVNMVIQGNVAMQVTQPGGQPWNFGSDVT